jgi:hypothetical protein
MSKFSKKHRFWSICKATENFIQNQEKKEAITLGFPLNI